MDFSKLDDTQWDIWAGGFFDADGCISARTTRQGMGIHLGIGQADPSVLFEFKRRYGGNIHHTKPSTKAHQVKCFYQYKVSSIDGVLNMLKRLAPYLASKKKQCDAAIPYIEERRWKTMTDEEFTKFFDELRKFKKENFSLQSLSEDDYENISNRKKDELRAGGF